MAKKRISVTSGSGSGPNDALRLAVLDLGTNTFNLVIGEVKPGRKAPELQHLFSDRFPVKLGKEGMEEGLISEPAQCRGLEALYAHLEKSREWEVDHTIAIATSGIRSSRNGKEYLERIRRNTDLEPEVIDGDREAYLIGEGVRAALPLGQEASLILDIGGGSSEFLIADQEHTYWKRSFEIGAARMLSDIDPSDPISEEELERTRRKIQEMLHPVLEAVKSYPVRSLIGTSGSFESISDMAFHRFPEAPDPMDRAAVEVSLEHFHKIHKALLGSTLEERLRMKGLAQMRAEMIVLGSVLIETVVERAGIERLFTSYYALREGALIDFARRTL